MGLLGIVTATFFLSGCIEAPVTVDLSGKVSWEGEAVAYPQLDGSGDFIALCAVEDSTCGATLPGDSLYTYMPSAGAKFAQFSPGTPVIPQGGGDPVGLPAGTYRLEVVQYGDVSGTLRVRTLIDIPPLIVGYVPEQGPPPVYQSIGLPSSGDCGDVDQSTLEWAESITGGWSKSWQQWVNDGEGGDVCTRTLAYNLSTGRWESG